MTRPTTPAIPAVLVVTILGACQPTPKAPPGGAQDPVSADRYPGVAVETPLQQFLVIDYNSTVVDRATPDKPMFVQIPARSSASTAMLVQYQYTWFDPGRRELGRTGWRMTSVDPGLQVMLGANAIDPAATQWRLEVRSAR